MLRKKLLVLDVNGFLVDTYYYKAPLPRQQPDGRVGNFYVYRRPHCQEFVKFCLANFVVGIWSSARGHNVNNLVDYVFGEMRESLAFCWNQSDCTNTGLKAPDNARKPIFVKELSRLWSNVKLGLPWKTGDYGPSNTLLIDDTPYKAILNPPNTAIFPRPFSVRDYSEDNLLGDTLQTFLKGVCDAADVQNYVLKNPFGEPSITSESPLWSYFRDFLKAAQGVVLGDSLVQLLEHMDHSGMSEASCEQSDLRNLKPTVTGKVEEAGVVQECDEDPCNAGNPCDTSRKTKVSYNQMLSEGSNKSLNFSILQSDITSTKDDPIHPVMLSDSEGLQQEQVLTEFTGNNANFPDFSFQAEKRSLQVSNELAQGIDNEGYAQIMGYGEFKHGTGVGNGGKHGSGFKRHHDTIGQCFERKFRHHDGNYIQQQTKKPWGDGYYQESRARHFASGPYHEREKLRQDYSEREKLRRDYLGRSHVSQKTASYHMQNFQNVRSFDHGWHHPQYGQRRYHGKDLSMKRYRVLSDGENTSVPWNDRHLSHCRRKISLFSRVSNHRCADRLQETDRLRGYDWSRYMEEGRHHVGAGHAREKLENKSEYCSSADAYTQSEFKRYDAIHHVGSRRDAYEHYGNMDSSMCNFSDIVEPSIRPKTMFYTDATSHEW